MNKLTKREGFTLVESLLAMVVMAAIFLVMTYILIAGVESYSLVVERREALQGARLAINIMENELQTIADPAIDISAIAANSISFTNAAGQSVTYQISGGTLLRNANILASNVDAASGFSYFTNGGGTTNDPAQVYRVDIIIAVDTGVAQYGTVEAKASVYLRNRYYDAFTKS